MSWLASFGLAFVLAVLGCFGAGFVAQLCVGWYRISSFEGGSGYFVVMIAAFGLIGGGVFGLVGSRLVPGGNVSFLHGLGVCSGALLLVLVTAAVICRFAADVSPKYRGKPLRLHLEVRTPRGWEWPATSEDQPPFVNLELPSRRGHPAAWLERENRRMDGERAIVTGALRLQTTAPGARLRVFFTPEQDLSFSFPRQGAPKPAELQWTGWIPADVRNSVAPRAEGFAYRYRLEEILPPPPPPSAEEVAARRSAEEERALAAISPAAPLQAWFPFTQPGAKPEHRAVAVERIAAKPGHVEELGRLMLDADPQRAVEALWLVEHLPASKGLQAEVERAGQHLISRLRTVVATPTAEDPSYEGAAEVSLRFHGWMVAVRALRSRGEGDFTPQLAEMLTLSRQRPDSHVLTQDVRRVASYYLQQWAGVAPLPGDPRPN